MAGRGVVQTERDEVLCQAVFRQVRLDSGVAAGVRKSGAGGWDTGAEPGTLRGREQSGCGWEPDEFRNSGLGLSTDRWESCNHGDGRPHQYQ